MSVCTRAYEFVSVMHITRVCVSVGTTLLTCVSLHNSRHVLNITVRNILCHLSVAKLQSSQMSLGYK